jgi:hypothetical protein
MTTDKPESKFPWYQVVEGDEFEQGDFLDELPILIQPDTTPVSKAHLEMLLPEIVINVTSISIFNVVIMTQSCDFNKMQDDDLATLCARYNYPQLYGKDRRKPLLEGRVVGAHILNKCTIDNHQFDYQVVDLTKVFSVPLSYLRKAGQERIRRIRLLPPYREHLSQAFARRFMRVGLPIDLPRDYPYE